MAEETTIKEDLTWSTFQFQCEARQVTREKGGLQEKKSHPSGHGWLQLLAGNPTVTPKRNSWFCVPTFRWGCLFLLCALPFERGNGDLLLECGNGIDLYRLCAKARLADIYIITAC